MCRGVRSYKVRNIGEILCFRATLQIEKAQKKQVLIDKHIKAWSKAMENAQEDYITLEKFQKKIIQISISILTIKDYLCYKKLNSYMIERINIDKPW
jgi:hypothetical protein